MRMKELVERSGMPRTRIHYYRRIGLLHAPEKSAVNAAVYDETHLERLRLLAGLRSTDGGSLPIFHLKRVVALLEEGVPVEQAVALQRAVLHSDPKPGGGSYSSAQLTAESGLLSRTVRELESSALLTRVPGATEFDEHDLNAARCFRSFLDLGVGTDQLELIARGIRQISGFEMAIAAKLIEGRPAQERTGILLGLQDAVNVLHDYLFLRSRQTEIKALGTPNQEERR
jgi:DNA-binding transcriptional MerR regulator